MNNERRRENEYFEDEVRRIARALWPSAEFAGATKIEGRERDGIFETEDCIHVVEATTSRQMDKARTDITKLNRILGKLRTRSGTRAVKGWFVTRDEPTADQRKVADKHRGIINSLSFSQFQARLIDYGTYLNARDNYHFGSVRDPGTGSTKLEIEYVPLDLLRVDSNDIVSHTEIGEMVLEGRVIVLLGDYGAGKSMTMREVYRMLRKNRFKGKTNKFPVYLNLRDHYGQNDPAEAIERHARLVGFSPPSHLVRAWRAGYVVLLIDGFDEIASASIQGLWRRLQDNRYRAMELVRRLIRDNPLGSGIVLAGRAHFFDHANERRRALGLRSESVELSLSEFTQGQIDTYLRRVGLSGSVPSWLPSRPLLVGYLAAKNVLGDIIRSSGGEMGPRDGWDMLLDEVSNREAEIEAGIDGGTVRRILERLSTKIRGSQTGLDSLTIDSIIKAFNEICGYNPDERGMVLLQRLPGLARKSHEEGTV